MKRTMADVVTKSWWRSAEQLVNIFRQNREATVGVALCADLVFAQRHGFVTGDDHTGDEWRADCDYYRKLEKAGILTADVVLRDMDL